MADPDDRLGAEALAIMAASRVEDLRSSAESIAALIAPLQQPIPQLPDNAEQRASLLLIMLLQSRDRERRWQKLCFPDV